VQQRIYFRLEASKLPSEQFSKKKKWIAGELASIETSAVYTPQTGNMAHSALLQI
jgi:hypothetical protein